jgi:hypothetical protein
MSGNATYQGVSLLLQLRLPCGLTLPRPCRGLLGGEFVASRAGEAYDARIRQSKSEFRGGASHGQPRQARSREEKAKENTTEAGEDASASGHGTQTVGATATATENRH